MDGNAKPRLAESLRGLIDSGLHAVQSRLELLSLEVQEEKLRLSGLVLNIVLCGLLLGFGIVFLMVFLTVYFWDDHRLVALGASTAVCLLGAAITGFKAASAFKRGSQLFAASLAELRRDRETFGREGVLDPRRDSGPDFPRGSD